MYVRPVFLERDLGNNLLQQPIPSLTWVHKEQLPAVGPPFGPMDRKGGDASA